MPPVWRSPTSMQANIAELQQGVIERQQRHQHPADRRRRIEQHFQHPGPLADAGHGIRQRHLLRQPHHAEPGVPVAAAGNHAPGRQHRSGGRRQVQRCQLRVHRRRQQCFQRPGQCRSERFVQPGGRSRSRTCHSQRRRGWHRVDAGPTRSGWMLQARRSWRRRPRPSPSTSTRPTAARRPSRHRGRQRRAHRVAGSFQPEQPVGPVRHQRVGGKRRAVQFRRRHAVHDHRGYHGGREPDRDGYFSRNQHRRLFRGRRGHIRRQRRKLDLPERPGHRQRGSSHHRYAGLCVVEDQRSDLFAWASMPSRTTAGTGISIQSVNNFTAWTDTAAGTFTPPERRPRIHPPLRRNRDRQRRGCPALPSPTPSALWVWFKDVSGPAKTCSTTLPPWPTRRSPTFRPRNPLFATPTSRPRPPTSPRHRPCCSPPSLLWRRPTRCRRRF